MNFKYHNQMKVNTSSYNITQIIYKNYNIYWNKLFINQEKYLLRILYNIPM